MSLVDKESATIASGLSTKELQALPMAQDYRDLQKFIPAVQYTEDTVRGPSAGGSGQDNVYLFDGANVTLPLFGNLSAEPASHDIAQVTVDHGRRPGHRLRPLRRLPDRLGQQVGHEHVPRRGELPVPDRGHVRGPRTAASSPDTSRTEAGGTRASAARSSRTTSTSTARTTVRSSTRDNRANLYGDRFPQYDSTRNEGFGKLTFTPMQSLLVNLSYRDSKRVDKSDLFDANAARDDRQRQRGQAAGSAPPKPRGSSTRRASRP